MTFFVLEERATKRWLPRNKFGTRAEFGDSGPPRLFTRRAAASSALSCWRMGVWRLGGDEDGYTAMPPDPSKAWNAEVIAARKDVAVDVIEVSVSRLWRQP